MASVLDELGLFRLADILGLSAVGAAAIWPRSATRAGITAHLRWLSPPGCPRLRTPRVPSPARRTSPGAAGPACGWPCGARCADVAVQSRAGGQVRGANPGRRCRASRRAPERPATAAAAAARARRAKARVACAASLLRRIYSIVVHGTSWDPAAAGGAGGQHALRNQPQTA
jgi:hypothetical protein